MRRTKMIFIDRDGVINKDPGGWTKYSYVTELKDLRFIPGALKALKILNRNGIKVIVISNQAGVGKGYFSEEKLAEVNAKMLDEISRHGGRIEEVYYCIHKDEDNCRCRKPKTGLLDDAVRKYHINPSETYFIGDSNVDVIAGRRIGAKTVFVLSGKTPLEEMKRWNERPDYVFRDLLEAVKWLVEKEKRRCERKVKKERIDRADEEDTCDIRDCGDRP